MTFRTHERKLRQLVVGIGRLVIIITMTGIAFDRRTCVSVPMTLLTCQIAVLTGQHEIRIVMVKSGGKPGDC